MTVAVLRRDGWPDALIRVCRDLARPQSFYPVAFRYTLCRVKPSFARGVADEAIALFNPLKDSRRFGVEHRALTLALAELAPRGNRQLAKLVRSVEFGPYDCPGDGPWHFAADIFESLDGSAKFFPIVRRRETYRMKTLTSKAPSDTVIDVVDTSFEPAKFVRASAQAALTSIADHIMGSFAPADRRTRPVRLRQTVEIVHSNAAGALTFVANIYDDPERKARFCSVFRRNTYRLSAGNINKPMLGMLERLEPTLVQKALASASLADARKAAVAAIERLRI